jgi:hypothetical protein
MAQRGKPSVAHEYGKNDACIHCAMYRVNVERSSHVCKPWRENQVDALEAEKAGLSVEEYRAGVTPSQTT